MPEISPSIQQSWNLGSDSTTFRRIAVISLTVYVFLSGNIIVFYFH